MADVVSVKLDFVVPEESLSKLNPKVFMSILSDGLVETMKTVNEVVKLPGGELRTEITLEFSADDRDNAHHSTMDHTKRFSERHEAHTNSTILSTKSI